MQPAPAPPPAAPGPPPVPDFGPRYVVLGQIGNGQTSTVFSARDLQGLNNNAQEAVAIKVFHHAAITRPYTASELRHHSLMSYRGHPHIINFREAFLSASPRMLCCAMDYADSGTLHAFVDREGPLEEDLCRRFFQQLILAVEFCHKCSTVLRDIKMENILMSEDPNRVGSFILKICDFGYAHSQDSRRWGALRSQVGSLAYMAPEVLRAYEGTTYDGTAADIWSCGVVLFAMLFGCHPFGYDSLFPPHHGDEEQPPLPEGAQQAIITQLLQRMDGQQIMAPSTRTISPEAEALLHQMLHPDPQQRPTMLQIFHDPWFSINLPPDTVAFNEVVLQSACNITQTQEHLARVLEEAAQLPAY